MQHELTGRQKLIQRITDAIHSGRVWLISLFALLAVFIVVYFVVYEVRRGRIETSTVQVEKAEQTLGRWAQQTDDEPRAQLAFEFLESIDRILSRYPRLYAAQRAYFLRGLYYYQSELYAEAAADFAEVANRFPKSYLAPVSLVSAAFSMEEKGDIPAAIAFNRRVVDAYAKESPEMPRVYFDLGRLYEAVGDRANARQWYERLLDSHPSSGWTNLARNRIILLAVD